MILDYLSNKILLIKFIFFYMKFIFSTSIVLINFIYFDLLILCINRFPEKKSKIEKLNFKLKIFFNNL